MEDISSRLSKKSYFTEFSPDDQFLALATGSRIDVYKTLDFSLFQSIKLKDPNFVHFIGKTNRICVNTTSGTLYIYDMLTAKIEKRFVSTKNRKYTESDFIIDENGKYLYLLAKVKEKYNLLAYSLEENSLKENLIFNGHYVEILQHIPNNHQISFLNSHEEGNSQLVIYNYETTEKELLEFEDNAQDFQMNVYISEEEIFGFSFNKVIKFKKSNNCLMIDQELLNLHSEEMINDIKFSSKKDLIIIVTSNKIYMINKNFKIIQEIEIEYGNHAQFNHTESLLVIGSWEKSKVYKL